MTSPLRFLSLCTVATLVAARDFSSAANSRESPELGSTTRATAVQLEIDQFSSVQSSTKNLRGSASADASITVDETHRRLQEAYNDEPPKSPFKLIPYRSRTIVSAQAPVIPMTPAATANHDGADPADEARPTFDFIVAGFPKCGTTTLLKAFGAHEETEMAPSEVCAIASPGQADHIVRRKLDDTLMEMRQDRHLKRAFKCPTAMYNYKSLVRMEDHSPKAKFVVGMRHPVKMLQSFYNYRVTEIYERETQEDIPSLHEVVASGEAWKGVSLESTRFELFLMQMGKTTVTPEQLRDFVGRQYDLAIKPTNFTVFLYTVDQLEDEDQVRSENLRTAMQKYLGLSTPIQPFGHENKNHQVGDAGHKESIDICNPEFAAMRQVLTVQGRETAAWLRDHFIESKDVVVANKEHFIKTLEDWGVDPCEAEADA